MNVYLHITSWRGISMGAFHYYGRLESDDFPAEGGTIELKRILTVSAARDLTKLQNDNSLFDLTVRYKEGDETRCFDTKEEIIELAKRVWKAHFPTAEKLLDYDTERVIV